MGGFKPTDIERRTDHLGNVFESRIAMCRHYKIPLARFDKRIKYGWSVEKALTYVEKINISDIEERTDHLGNVFESRNAMCDYWGITKTQYTGRLERGKSKEEILTNSNEVVVSEIDRTDHLGNVFKSQKQMCDYYHITQCNYQSRIKSGWSKEKALTYKEIKREEDDDYRTDHLGNVFESRFVMCRHYNVLPNQFKEKIKMGYSKEEALCIIPRIFKNIKRNTSIGENILIISFAYNVENNQYFKCRLNGKMVILSREDILEEYRKLQNKGEN